MRRSTFSGISRPMTHASDEPLSPAEVETLGYHQRSLSHPPPQQVASEYDFHTSTGGLQSPSAPTWPINAAPLGGVAPSRLGPAHTHVTHGPDRDPVVAHGHAVAAAHDQEGQVGPRMRGVCGALPSADAAAAKTLSAGMLTTTLSHTSTYKNTTFLSSSSTHAGMYGGYPASASSLSDDDYNRRASLFDNMALTDTEGLRPQYAHQFSPVSHEQHQFDLPVQQPQSGRHRQQQQQHHHHNPHQHPLPHTSFHLHPLPHAAAAASALDPNPGSDYYTDQSFSGTRSRNLETRGRSLSDAGAPGDGDPVQLKRLRNTEAARRSRLRRIAHIDQLEARIAELEAENHRLILRVANLESDRAARQSQSQHRPGEPWGGGPTAQHQVAQVGNSPNPGMAPLGAFGSMENIMSSDSPHP